MSKLPKWPVNNDLASQLPLIGKRSNLGPGGRDCPRCNVEPGKSRKVDKRHNKRSKRQRTQQLINREVGHFAYQMGWC